MRKQLLIENIGCAACTSKIVAALGRIDGLSDIIVDRAAERIVIRYTPPHSEREIREHIELADLCCEITILASPTVTV